MTTIRRLAALLACLLLQGCVIIDVSATNPIPGMSRIAVIPFRNLTPHPDSVADGRRFAITYASELQKVPGFEVVPVGVTEVAMLDNGLTVASPENALKLARLLDVDAVVVGAITHYDPYYPPKLGLTVEWLSPHPWLFSPGIPTDPAARERLLEQIDKQGDFERQLHAAEPPPHIQRIMRDVTIRGQSDEPAAVTAAGAPLASHPIVQVSGSGGPQLPSSLFDGAPPGESTPGLPPAPRPDDASVPPLPVEVQPRHLPGRPEPDHLHRAAPPRALPAGPNPIPQPLDVPSRDRQRPPAEMPPPSWTPEGTVPTRPVMAYTRFFDGADADLVAELRDYVELNGDLRAGGWKAYLQRSDDFIRFACHRMIEEMLILHGGEGKRRIVLKLRKYR